jgi:hypothetical protein
MDSSSDILSLMPSPPPGYSYRVDKVSPLVSKVVLVFPEMLRKSGIECVHCFIKNGKVFPASNGKTAQARSVGTLADLPTMSPWTVNQMPKGSVWDENQQCFVTLDSALDVLYNK